MLPGSELPISIFTGRSNPALARKIAASYGQELGQITIKNFSDGEIFCQIGFRIVQRYFVFLQQRMDLKPRLKAEETPHLTLGQGTRPVPLHGDGFQGMAGHVSPLPCEGFRDVFRQADRDAHGTLHLTIAHGGRK